MKKDRTKVNPHLADKCRPRRREPWRAFSVLLVFHACRLAQAAEDKELMVAGEFSLDVGKHGFLSVQLGEDRYIVESSFSYPGASIGWNMLPSKGGECEPGWRPLVRRLSKRTLAIAAEGQYYRFQRRVTYEGRKIRLWDTFANKTASPLALMILNRITTPGGYKECLLGGTKPPGNPKFDSHRVESMLAENPTVFFSRDHSSLGILAEDNIMRLQMEAKAEAEGARFHVQHFALGGAKRYTFEWAIYPFSGGADYFTFVNQIRKDWRTNFTLEGQFEFFSPRQEAGKKPLLEDPAELKRYVARKGLRIVTMQPWLDYWNGAGIPRAEYKRKMQKALRAFREASPEVKVLGCVESNIVSIDKAKIHAEGLFDDVSKLSGDINIPLSAEQTAYLERKTPWKDSFIRNRDGRIIVEDCYPTTFVHPLVYAKPGNYHARYLMEQFKFLIEEVGTDGVYVDQFNMAIEWVGYGGQRYDYSTWDGHSVDVDPATGKIARYFTDAALVGASIRKGLCEYVLSKGKILVANTNPSVRETQSLPTFRFIEGWGLGPLDFLKEGEPPLSTSQTAAHLGSPLALGIRTEVNENYTKVIMKSAIHALRNGVLTYEYNHEVPVSGPGSGDYGPLTRMFPFTPLELHKGWLVGKERIIAAVSLDTLWAKESPRLNVLFFDLSGRATEATGRYKLSKEEGKWRVVLELKDWQEIAVVE